MTWLKQRTTPALVITLFVTVVLAVLAIPTAQYMEMAREAQAATLNLATTQPFQAGGRCTLTTGTPVMVASATSQTTTFYTPYLHNRISIYNGDNLVLYEFAELSNITSNAATGSAGPAAVAASSNYDLFVWNKSGTVTFTRGPAWTSVTARALTLSQTKGVWVNGQAITNGPAINRGTYVCTEHSASDSTITFQYGKVTSPPGMAQHDVWNMYNRVLVAGTVGDTTDTWTYQATAIRPSNSSVAARVNFVVGLAEDPVHVINAMRVANNGTTVGLSSLGLDATNAYPTAAQGVIASYGTTTAGNSGQNYAAFNSTSLGIGFHFISGIESASNTTALVTYVGDISASFAGVQSGLVYELRM